MLRSEPRAWLAAHAGLTLLLLRVSETRSRTGLPAGIALGIACGLLVITLIACARNIRRLGDSESSSLRSYCALARQVPSFSDFVGAVLSFVLWFALCSDPVVNGFKLLWLTAAVLTAAAIARVGDVVTKLLTSSQRLWYTRHANSGEQPSLSTTPNTTRTNSDRSYHTT